jgi:hypothetical protein
MEERKFLFHGRIDVTRVAALQLFHRRHRAIQNFTVDDEESAFDCYRTVRRLHQLGMGMDDLGMEEDEFELEPNFELK